MPSTQTSVFAVRYVLAALVALAWGGLPDLASAQTPLVPGALAPHFVGKTTEGKALNLASTRGRVTLLNFFLTSYKDEAEHLRMIERLRAQFERRGLAILSVALDQGRPEAIAAFVRKCDVHHPVLLDENWSISTKFGVQAAPTVYLLSPLGAIVRYQEGYMPGDQQTLGTVISSLIDHELGPGDHPDKGLCHCYAPRP